MNHQFIHKTIDKNDKQVLLIDMDDVLNLLKQSWIDLYNVAYNDNFTLDKWTIFDIHNLVKPECGIKIFDFLDKPGLYRNLPVAEYAQTAIPLLQDKYNIFVVSNCGQKHYDDKIEWLKEHFPTINPKNFIACNRKYMIKGDILIDDFEGNFEHFTGLRFLYTSPTNRNLIQGFDSSFDIRVNNWKEICENLL